MPETGGIIQIAQHAEDLERATAFYRDTLGLEVISRFDPPGLVFMRLGEVRLLLERGASSATIYLSVTDIESETTSLRDKGVEIVGDPHLIHIDETGDFGAPGTEEWMAFIRDSEGNLLGLVERRPSEAAQP